MIANKNRYFSPFFVFLFFFFLVSFSFRDLFFFYFEADEWFHFTHYLPLTHNPYGFLIAPIKSVTDAIALSEGQHVVPIGEEIFFLSAKFFGMNFSLYAFMSLLLHSINSFLVFLLITELLRDTKFGKTKAKVFAYMGGIFFALTAIPMHAVTWAAFFGQNVLSVTFFLLCLLFLKKGFSTKQKKYIVLSMVCFILDLLTKETSIVLAFIIPFMIFLEKRTYSWKLLTKIFLVPFLLFLPFRFLLPKLYLWFDKTIIITQSHAQAVPTDVGVLIYRIFNFPLNMISEVFFSRQTILSLMEIITPILYLQFAGEAPGRAQNRMFFLYGPGNEFLVYLFAILIILLTFFIVRKYYQTKKQTEAHVVLTGFFIIIVCALPLVVNVLFLPAWGTDFFDGRHYYMPSVGAAILLPFLLFAIADIIAKTFRLIRLTIPVGLIVFFLFGGWLVGNMIVFQETMKNFVTIIGSPRREIIKQLQAQLPVLPQNAVIHFETDGGGPFGPVLPFQTSIPQMLSVVYYDKNTLPESFYNKFILDTKAEGYQTDQGRALGYYATKKTLADALVANKFTVNNVYSFYYDSKTVTVTDRTDSMRKEMKKYLTERGDIADWKHFQDASSTAKLQFSYPPDMEIITLPIATTEAYLVKSFQLDNPQLSASLKIMKVTPTFDPSETSGVIGRISNQSFLPQPVTPKTVSLDAYHTNNMFVIKEEFQVIYLMKVEDMLLSLTTESTDEISLSQLEKILGSVSLTK